MHTQPLIDSLAPLVPGPPHTAGLLTLIPLTGPSSEACFTSLATPGISDLVQVRELSESGRVRSLVVENRSPFPTFLLDGEEVLGGKQSRVVNSSLLVPPGSETVIPVSCCEAGRWARSVDGGFRSEGRAMPSSMRSSKSMRVSANLRRSGQHDGDQRAIWEDIAQYSAERGVRSRTSAMGDVFEADRQQLKELIEEVEPLPNQVGVIAVAAGNLLAVEVLASAALYAEVHRKLLHSFGSEAILRASSRARPTVHHPRTRRMLAVLEANGVSPDVIAQVAEAAKETAAVVNAPDAARALRFARRVLEGEATTHDTAGLGADVRVTSPRGQATALVHEEHLVHLSVFPNQRQRRRSRRQPRWV